MICKKCSKLYFSKVIRLSKVIENTCEECNETFMSYDNCYHKVCKECSKEYGLCEICGKDIK